MTVVVLRLKLNRVTVYTLLRLQTSGARFALNSLLVTSIRMSRVTFFVQTALAEVRDTCSECCCQHSGLVQVSDA